MDFAEFVINDDQIVIVGAKHILRLGTGVGLGNAEVNVRKIPFLQHGFDAISDNGLIVDDENPDIGWIHGVVCKRERKILIPSILKT